MFLEYLKKLAELRMAAGLTQIQLGQILAVGQPNIARMEKEKGSESISLQQLENWLKACGFITYPNASFLEKLAELPIFESTRYAHAIENLLYAKGFPVDLRGKPLIAVSPGKEDATRLMIKFIRTLLSFGDRNFFGFYKPPAQATVLWKHVSDRPLHRSDSVYVLDGILEPWMRSAPTEFLPISSQTGEVARSGSTAVINDDSRVVVLFADHPLLRYADLLQTPSTIGSLQSFRNWQSIVNAEICILTCLESPGLTASAFVMGAARGTSYDFLAFSEDTKTVTAEEFFASIYGNRPRSFNTPTFDGAIQGSSESIKQLVSTVGRWSLQAQQDTARLLADPYNFTGRRKRAHSKVAISPQSKKQEVLATIIEKVTDDLDGQDSYSNLFKLTQVLTNTKLDSPFDIVNPDSYKNQVLKAFDAFDSDLNLCLIPSPTHQAIPDTVLEWLGVFEMQSILKPFKV